MKNTKNQEEKTKNTKEKVMKKDINVMTRKNRIFYVIAVICICVMCAAVSSKVLQNDTFYNIKIGEYLTQHGLSDLTKDVYSWHDLPYTYPHWLYDFLIYQVFRLFSWDGIYGATIVLTSILGLSIFFISNKLSKNKVVSFLVTLGAMYLIKPYIPNRAQLVTFILFAWTVFFIEKFLEKPKNAGEKNAKVLYALMLLIIPLLITNLHCAVFPFYFVLFLPYIGEYLVAVFFDWDLDKRILYLFVNILSKVAKKEARITKFSRMKSTIKEQIVERKARRAKRRENPYKIKITKNHRVLLLIAVMVIAAGTGFLNPAGTGAYTYVYKTMQGNTTASINEHLPLELISAREFLTSLIIFLLILIFTDTKIKLSDLFMLTGLTYLSLKMRRQVSMYTIFGSYIMAKLISSFLEKYAKDLSNSFIRIFTKPIGAIIVFAIVGCISYDIYKPIKDSAYIDENSYPVAASEWIKENLDLTYVKFYNEYNFGSYMLYEDIPVFIDSRCDLYTPEFNGDEENGIEGKDIFSDALNIAGYGVDYNVYFENYGVTHIISYANSKLCLALSSDSKYRKLYDDGTFRIYAKIDKERDQEKIIPTITGIQRPNAENQVLQGSLVKTMQTKQERNMD